MITHDEAKLELSKKTVFLRCKSKEGGQIANLSFDEVLGFLRNLFNILQSGSQIQDLGDTF